MKLQSKQKSITVRHIIKQNRIEIPEINFFFFFWHWIWPWFLICDTKTMSNTRKIYKLDVIKMKNFCTKDIKIPRQFNGGLVSFTEGACTIKYSLVVQKNEFGCQHHTIYTNRYKIGN